MDHKGEVTNLSSCHLYVISLVIMQVKFILNIMSDFFPLTSYILKFTRD